MPTVQREGPYRFFFYSADRSGGFGAAELQHVERLVIARGQEFLGAWDEYFTIAD